MEQDREELYIDYGARQVRYRDMVIGFTRTEFELIEFLSKHKGEIWSKEEIYRQLWEYVKDGNSSILMEHIRRIRNKLRNYTEKEYIQTVWGKGYRWVG